MPGFLKRVHSAAIAASWDRAMKEAVPGYFAQPADDDDGDAGGGRRDDKPRQKQNSPGPRHGRRRRRGHFGERALTGAAAGWDRAMKAAVADDAGD